MKPITVKQKAVTWKRSVIASIYCLYCSLVKFDKTNRAYDDILEFEPAHRFSYKLQRGGSVVSVRSEK